MAEHRTVAAVVAGSTPVVRPNKTTEVFNFRGFLLKLVVETWPTSGYPVSAYGACAINPHAKKLYLAN